MVTLPDILHTPALDNPYSDVYMELAQQITKALEDMYDNIPGEQFIQIIDFV